MTILLDLPDDIAQALGVGQDVSRTALEGYRSGRLSEEQVRRMLGFDSRFQVHVLLKQHGTHLKYTQDDLEQDLETAHRLSQK